MLPTCLWPSPLAHPSCAFNKGAARPAGRPAPPLHPRPHSFNQATAPKPATRLASRVQSGAGAQGAAGRLPCAHVAAQLEPSCDSRWGNAMLPSIGSAITPHPMCGLQRNWACTNLLESTARRPHAEAADCRATQNGQIARSPPSPALPQHCASRGSVHKRPRDQLASLAAFRARKRLPKPPRQAPLHSQCLARRGASPGPPAAALAPPPPARRWHTRRAPWQAWCGPP